MARDSGSKVTAKCYCPDLGRISDTQTKNHKKIDKRSGKFLDELLPNYVLISFVIDIYRYGGLLEFNHSDAALESFKICKNTKGQEYYRVEYKIFLSITDHLLSWEVVVPTNSGTWKSFPAKDINVAAAFAPGS